MALRDQPYMPFYVQDYLSDEKLSCCSLSTQGVYIRILCVLHKSDTYGGILFKQIPKQNLSSSQYFAFVLSRQTGVEEADMSEAIKELLFFDVLRIRQVENVDFLYQKRMERDFEISEKRSKAAKKGGGNPILFKQNSSSLFKQKDKQNPEYDNEYENIDKGKGGMGEKPLRQECEEFEEKLLSQRFSEVIRMRTKVSELGYKKAINDFLAFHPDKLNLTYFEKWLSGNSDNYKQSSIPVRVKNLYDIFKASGIKAITEQEVEILKMHYDLKSESE